MNCRHCGFFPCHGVALLTLLGPRLIVSVNENESKGRPLISILWWISR